MRGRCRWRRSMTLFAICHGKEAGALPERLRPAPAIRSPSLRQARHLGHHGQSPRHPRQTIRRGRSSCRYSKHVACNTGDGSWACRSRLDLGRTSRWLWELNYDDLHKGCKAVLWVGRLLNSRASRKAQLPSFLEVIVNRASPDITSTWGQR